MDIAAAVGAERLREIMTELLDRSTAVVKRYGGTLSQFTGDGIMAVFGAPITLEDHAIRACLAALGIQAEAKQLGAEVRDHDGIDLRLRVGLNSGQVIAGEIGSGSYGYTAIGEQVGMAQRMESVVPPGGVMVSKSTARLAWRRHSLAGGEQGILEPSWRAERAWGRGDEPDRRIRQSTADGVGGFRGRDRLDRAGRASRPRVVSRRPRPILRDLHCSGGAPRRPGRQIHRRCRRRRLRSADCA
jgi:hypothetical protein